MDFFHRLVCAYLNESDSMAVFGGHLLDFHKVVCRKPFNPAGLFIDFYGEAFPFQHVRKDPLDCALVSGHSEEVNILVGLSVNDEV